MASKFVKAKYDFGKEFEICLPAVKDLKRSNWCHCSKIITKLFLIPILNYFEIILLLLFILIMKQVREHGYCSSKWENYIAQKRSGLLYVF